MNGRTIPERRWLLAPVSWQRAATVAVCLLAAAAAPAASAAPTNTAVSGVAAQLLKALLPPSAHGGYFKASIYAPGSPTTRPIGYPSRDCAGTRLPAPVAVAYQRLWPKMDLSAAARPQVYTEEYLARYTSTDDAAVALAGLRSGMNRLSCDRPTNAGYSTEVIALGDEGYSVRVDDPLGHEGAVARAGTDVVWVRSETVGSNMFLTTVYAIEPHKDTLMYAAFTRARNVLKWPAARFSTKLEALNEADAAAILGAKVSANPLDVAPMDLLISVDAMTCHGTQREVWPRREVTSRYRLAAEAMGQMDEAAAHVDTYAFELASRADAAAWMANLKAFGTCGARTELDDVNTGSAHTAQQGITYSDLPHGDVPAVFDAAIVRRTGKPGDFDYTLYGIAGSRGIVVAFIVTGGVPTAAQIDAVARIAAQHL